MARYGDYIRCNRNEIEDAKAMLTLQAVNMVRESATNDEFWLISERSNTDGRGEIEIGFIIDIPDISTYPHQGNRG